MPLRYDEQDKGETEMKHITIPGTSLSFPRVAASFAPPGTDYTETETYYLLDAYLDAGGVFLDTANVYGRWFPGGQPLNELWMGRYFARRKNRHKFLLDSKGGAFDPWNKGVARVNARCIRADLENSLSNLKTDYLDYYWVHVDCPQTPVEEILDVLNEEKKAGRIRYFGCSNWSVRRIEQAQDYAARHQLEGFTANQSMKNLACPNLQAVWDDGMTYLSGELEKMHREKAFPLFAYTAAARGYFSLFDQPAFLMSEVCRSPRALFENPATRKRAQAVRRLADETGWDPSQIALAYLYHQPYPTVPVIGVQSVRDICNVLIAMELPLTRDMLCQITQGGEAQP